jgi:hypothetical protein
MLALYWDATSAQLYAQQIGHRNEEVTELFGDDLTGGIFTAAVRAGKSN